VSPNNPHSTGHFRIGLIILLAIAAAATACWYFAPGFLPDPLKALVPALPKENPLLYKWRDAKGQPHVTDTPPIDRPYETLHYNPNTNVVPSVMPPPGTTHE